MMICEVCGKKAEVSLGTCCECTEAESIIENGFDIMGWSLTHAQKQSASKAKLKFMIQKGWRYIPEGALNVLNIMTFLYILCAVIVIVATIWGFVEMMKL